MANPAVTPVQAYADTSGRIHPTHAEAQKASDAIAANHAWLNLLRHTEARGGHHNDFIVYAYPAALLKDRTRIEELFEAVDRANGRGR